MFLMSTQGAAQYNPIDEESNPTAYNYRDVEIAPPDMNETFVRDGATIDPDLIFSVTPGLDHAIVQAKLGPPVRRQKNEWDYNFRFKMPDSENFLICQYKIIFDGNMLVRKTVWRRRQCQQLAFSNIRS